MLPRNTENFKPKSSRLGAFSYTNVGLGFIPEAAKCLQNKGFGITSSTKLSIISGRENFLRKILTKNIFQPTRKRPFTTKHTYPQHPSKPHIFPGEVAH